MMVRPPTWSLRASARLTAAAAGFACLALPVWAQDQPAARQATPERPTVATHAYAVLPGTFEVESGVQWQRPVPTTGVLSSPTLLKIGLGRRVQLDIAPGWLWAGEDGSRVAGVADLAVGIKWQVAKDLPVLADFAVQPMLKFATGSSDKGTGTDTTDVSILLISSRSIGPVALDLNVGYTRRSGDGTAIPVDSTLWAVSTGFPVAGRLGWVAEVFGYPGTSGPAGYKPIVAFLTGPTVTLKPTVVVDTGVILDISHYGGNAWYAGATWNIARLQRAHAPQPPGR
jgi:hypothetical protein